MGLARVLVLKCFATRDAKEVAKAAAKRNIFLGAVVKTVFIPNDSGAEKAIEDSRRFLERGVNVIIFPEGTRVSSDAKKLRLNRGAARLALASKAPLVACHIEYDPPVLGKKQAWFGQFIDTIENIVYNVRTSLEKVEERWPKAKRYHLR